MAQDKTSDEIMLAQEQAVISRGPGLRQETESAFGFGKETEGTLVLTNRRLVYVHGNEKETDIRIGLASEKRLIFSDVESLQSMAMDSSSFAIPLSRIVSVMGHHVEAGAPKLEVKWTDESGKTMANEFVQQITGRSRKKNLNDWAAVIGKIRSNQLSVKTLPTPPEMETLEGKILSSLGDMQEKGPFTIEEVVEEEYKVQLQPDDVEAACERLASAGLLTRTGSPGEQFYRKVSPLGDDDLSA